MPIVDPPKLFYIHTEIQEGKRMTIYDLLSDFAIASVLILVGQFLRAKIKFFQEFFIPASLIAGLLGLLLGQQCLGVLQFSSGAGSYAGMLIIIVFTVVGVNGFEIKKGEGAATAQRVASFTCYRFFAFFIQFALGIAATLLVIKFLVPDLNPGFGVLMASGFTGGHGTAAAVGTTLAGLGFEEAGDLGMTFATAGILTGVFGGLIVIKIATRKGWTAYVKDFKFIDNDLRTGLVAKENRQSMGEETISSVSLDGLGFHVALVFMVAGLGYMLNKYILAPYVISGIPDFTVSYIVGLIFFLIFGKTKVYNYVDKNVNSRVSGTATDFLVFFGVALINLKVIVEYALPLIVLILVGILCVILCIVPFGSGMNNKSWFERSIFVYGYSTGVFAIGFVLLRIVDPNNKSYTVDDTAMSPWLSFCEVFMWSAIPTMLVAGQGWLAAGLCALVCVASVVISFIFKMWYKQPLDARGGYQLNE